MKKRKTFISFILAFALCFGLTGCGMAQELANSYNTKELSDEEVVLAFMEAYQQGDYEALKPYISEDNPLHLFFGGMDEAVGGEMAASYLHRQSCGGRGSLGHRQYDHLHAGLFQGLVRRHGRRLNRPGGKRNHCLSPYAGLDCQRHRGRKRNL